MRDAAQRRPMHDRLVRYLARESAATRSEVEELHALPVEERIGRSSCLDALRFVRWEDRGSRLALECAVNGSRFREGERLSLGYGADPRRGVSVIYRAYDPRSRTLEVSKDRWNLAGWDDLDLGRPLVLDRAMTDFGEVALGAIEAVYKGADERARLIRLIVERTATPVIDERRAEEAEHLAAVFALDASQREAFVQCHARVPYHLVQGPPGSGKTHLIACLVAAWMKSGERVLVTAYTHRAVNNVLGALARLDPGARAVKCGDEADARDLPPSVRRARSAKEIESLPKDVAPVVGATVFALRRFWDRVPFDRVLFDEAAQIPIPHAVCGMLAGKRYVFVGDHRQLGPIVAGEHRDELAGLSIFAHLAGAHGVSAGPSLLRRTYRMNAGINDFPSREFYEGALRPGEGCAARRFPGGREGPLAALLDPDRPAVLAAISHEGSRTRSLAEAQLAVDLLEEMLLFRMLPASEIAVVTPYRAQIRLIRSLAETRLGAPGRAADLPVIDTVERIQGQEREAVIVSLACSDPEYAAREAEFVFSPNRLNVTLTRARTKLVLIMSPLLLSALPTSLSRLRDVSRFARLFAELPRVDLTDRYLP